MDILDCFNLGILCSIYKTLNQILCLKVPNHLPYPTTFTKKMVGVGKYNDSKYLYQVEKMKHPVSLLFLNRKYQFKNIILTHY